MTIASFRLPACLRLLDVPAMAFLVLAAVAASPNLLAQETGSANVLLKGGQVDTQTDRGVIQADLLILEGRVAELAPDLETPEGVRVVDVSGMLITPGWIDARSSLWMSPAAANESASDGGLDARDGVDPTDPTWQDVIAAGITTVYVQPGASGSLGGRGVVLRVGPGRSASDLIVHDAAGAQASLGIGGNSNTSRDRHAQFDRLKSTLEAAKKYGEEWDAYRKWLEEQENADEESEDASEDEAATDDERPADARGPGARRGGPGRRGPPPGGGRRGPRPGGGPPPGRGQDEESDESEDGDEDADDDDEDDDDEEEERPSRPDYDPAKEFLVKVVRGEVPLRMEAHRPDDIRRALEIGEAFPELHLILDGVSHPGATLDTLTSARPPLVLGPAIESGSAPAYRRQRQPAWPHPLIDVGGRWALGTFASSGSSADLRLHAAALAADGVDRAKLLSAVTRDAASILGIEDRRGRIDVDREADLVVFAGDPLDPSVPVRLAIAGGSVAYENEAARPRSDGWRLEASAESTLPATLPARFALRTTHCWVGSWQPALLEVEDGVVRSVVLREDASSEFPVFDLGHAPVTPGLICGHTRFAPAGDVDDPAEPVAAHLRAVDLLEINETQRRKWYRQGVTMVGVAPGSVNVVAGNLGAVRLTPNLEVVNPHAALKIVMTSSARNTARYPASLVGQMQLVDRFLSREPVEMRLYVPDLVRRQIQERQREIATLPRFRGVGVDELETRVLFETEESREAAAAVELIRSHELPGVLLGPGDLDESIIEALADQGIGMMVRSPRTRVDREARLAQIVKASERGVPSAFAAEQSPREARTTAALAVRAGMDPGDALAGLTEHAARFLGLPSGYGSITEGAPADLVIWSGSPLDVSRAPLAVLLDGEQVEESEE